MLFLKSFELGQKWVFDP